MKSSRGHLAAARSVVPLALAFLLLAAACNDDDDVFAQVPQELADAAVVTMEGGYTLTVTHLADDGTVREELVIQRIGMDRLRRTSSLEGVPEVVAVDHTAYSEDPNNPGAFLRNEISSAAAFDPAYSILERLSTADEVALDEGVYRFVVTDEQGAASDVTARLSDGRITEMSVITPQGTSVLRFEYGDVPSIERPPPARTAPITPQPT